MQAMRDALALTQLWRGLAPGPQEDAVAVDAGLGGAGLGKSATAAAPARGAVI